MSAANDLIIMKASMLLDADPAGAAREAGAILAQQPDDEPASLLFAAACRRLGDSARAVEVIGALAAAHPESAWLQLELGRSLESSGRSDEAMVALTRATTLDPKLASGWRALSSLALAAGDIQRADAAYLNFRRLTLDPADLGDAYAAFAQGHFDAAQVAVQRRLQAGTNEEAAFTLLAAIASRRGDDFGEEGSLLEIQRIAPCDNIAREQFVRLLLRQGRLKEALPVVDRLLRGEPESFSALLLQAEAMRLMERHAEGLQIIQRLIAKKPADPELWLFAGNQQRYMGDSGTAVESYRHALTLNPNYGAAYLALSNLKTFRFDDADVQSMRASVYEGSLGIEEMAMRFALGKALEDQQRFESSFEQYARANALARADFEYDASAMDGFVQRFKATFMPDFFSARGGWGNDTQEPIFIVGLPRSGSTLLEQILASHSAVEGTRELSYLPLITRELAGTPEVAARYPENLARLTRADVEALAARYLASADEHRVLGRARFIDKMHGNFQSLGLIHLMFPRASIIDARRHPMATGFACYKQLFNPGMNFAYELREFGLYYRDYVELTRHIDAVLPGRVHRVQYERMVADTEAQVRALLDYCHLSFEPACLKFHETKRVAQTISSEQVRRPIYSESVDQWRRYEPWLEPLKAALGGLAEH